jgi:1,4-dihydroxy-2-naphthoate octaprenyltransferase
MLLYALGAAFAWRQGILISPSAYLLGQALVTSIQLMTHYINEYYDQEADCFNTAGRTWFSGGSGVLVDGSLSPLVARRAGYLMAALALFFLLVAGLHVPLLFPLGLLSLLAAWFYSAPPLSLARSGWGELSASLVVALLVPVVSYTQQAHEILEPGLLLTCLPLVFIHWAMLIAFQIPDISADRQAGKRTLSVRIGARRAIQIHHLLLILAAVSALAVGSMGFPAVQFAWLALPLAVWHMVTASAYLRSTPPPYLWLTMRAVGLFALCSLLWLIGIALG